MKKQYICGCGKSYGSYPAFSTHRKIKHNNQYVQGTILPPQEKAKRGRPTYDFKKIPKSEEHKQIFYQSLTVIQNGLLELQNKYKGQILADCHQKIQDIEIQKIEQFFGIKQDREIQKQRIRNCCEFIKLFTMHTHQKINKLINSFFKSYIKYGCEKGQFMNFEFSNTYFHECFSQTKNDTLDVDFYKQLLILFSQWLYCIGKTSETLRISSQKNDIIQRRIVN